MTSNGPGDSPPDGRYIRVKALAIIRRGDSLLVCECYDPAKDQHFHRSPGGTLEFGETAEAALHREIHEELGCGLASTRLLDVVENIYTFNGRPGHEVLFLYDAELEDRSFYEREVSVGRESDGAEYRLVWRSLADRSLPLYPDGLPELLANAT